MAQRDITPARLEAFSDGVIAIIITIMVLELKVPHSAEPSALFALWPVFVSYALSYFFVAVYWMNHHHLFHRIRQVDTGILWSNIALLFCVSLLPFSTAYMGENHFSPFSTLVYCGTTMACALSFLNLLRAITHRFDRDDAELQAFRRAALRKNLTAIGIYTVAVAIAMWSPLAALILTLGVMVIYALPSAGLGKVTARP